MPITGSEFDSFYKENRQSLERVAASKYVNAPDPQAAADDAVLQAAKQARSLDELNRFAHHNTKHIGQDQRRLYYHEHASHGGPHESLERRLEENPQGIPDTRAQDPETTIIQKEAIQEVWDAMEPRARQVIAMRQYGLPDTEIAARLGMKPSSVGSAIQTNRVRLAKKGFSS